MRLQTTAGFAEVNEKHRQNMKTENQQTARQAFRAKIEKMIRYANGYYYIGDYQPATMTGRYETREAATSHQMDCYDLDPLGTG
jgi:hypothetical protein